MAESTSRLAGLSTARRKLLDELLRTRPQPVIRAEAPATAPSGPVSLTSDSKRSCQEFFDEINRQLGKSVFGNFSFFLNFGYISNLNPEFAVVPLPQHALNRSSMKLILEVLGDCPLNNRRLLDVGCGRGASASVIAEFFQPKHFIGVDLSKNAVTFCHARHINEGMAFYQADAENLPFQNASMDVVINIESSSSYPNLRAFYFEVFRVLSAGGHFLYSDVLPVRQLSECTELLKSIGFRILKDRDITSNVLLSCDEVARNRMQAYRGPDQVGVLSNFLGAPGSHVYEEMKSGFRSYRILHLLKNCEQ
jgi:phthiocerol/phenolphthiocerol synthesis type-I polyketide synthase E